MKYYIKQRYNPQLGTYYSPCGQLAATEAKRRSKAIYGSNTMLEYNTLAEYEAALAKLKQDGAKVI